MSTVAVTGKRSTVALSVFGPRRVGVGRGVLMVVAVTVLLWCFRLSGPIDLRYDGGVYYVLGTSLASGHGYRLANEPGSPQAIQYPPGLPALVALHQWALGTADPTVVGVWLKRSFFILHLALAVAVFFLARTMLGECPGLIAAFLSLIQLNGYLLSNLLFTELPFTLVGVLLALTLLSDRLRARPFVREAIGFMLAATGFALRTAGLALLLAWIGEAMIRRHWRLAFMRAVLAALPVAGWQAYVATVQHSEAYRQPAYAYQRAPYQFYNVSYAENLALVDPFQPELGRATTMTLISRAAVNVAHLPISLGEAASEVRGFWSGAIKTICYPGQKHVGWLDALSNLPLIPVSAIVLLGAWQWMRRREWFPLLFVSFSIALTCATPWPVQFARYLSPIGPFLAIALVIGAQETLGWLRRPHPPALRRTGWWIAGILFAGFASAHAYAALNSFRSMVRTPVPAVADDWSSRRWFYYDLAWADWDRAVDWLARNSPPNAVVATSVPQLCYLMSGRLSVFPPMEANPSLASELLVNLPVSYVVIDELDFLDIARRYAEPAVNAAPDEWQLLKRFNKTLIFGRVHPPENHHMDGGK